jgi:UDP:flavonoid glycosyltransferase YjiC (YdhE family)
MGALKRILFLAEGATMAHFVRPVALADSLAAYQDEYEIHLYAPSRFAADLAGKFYSTGELKSAPGEHFLANIARGKPLFSPDVLRAYVPEDCQLIRRIRPDLVVGDMRLSLPISARLEKVPSAVIINAYWSPYAKRRCVLPELPLTRLIPPRWLAPLNRGAQPIVSAMHVAQMNRVRKEFGVPPLPLETRKMFTDGDYVLYPDVREFVPTDGAPPNHHYVGICDWARSAPKPEWWERMCADPNPKVFISLGSSGPIRVLPALLAGNIDTADLLPFIETAAQAAVVVTHGGSGGLYPAMAAGTPMLAIPSNADQHLSTALLEENGAGLGVRVEEATVGTLLSSARRILSEASFARAAARWATIFQQDAARNRFREFLKFTFP